MSRIDLTLATVPWLEEYLTRFRGLAVHVPRTVAEARKSFIENSLHLSTAKTPGIGQDWIWVYATGPLGADDIVRVMQAEIVHEARTYRFSSLEAQKGDHEDASPILEIGYQVAPPVA